MRIQCLNRKKRMKSDQERLIHMKCLLVTCSALFQNYLRMYGLFLKVNIAQTWEHYFSLSVCQTKTCFWPQSCQTGLVKAQYTARWLNVDSIASHQFQSQNTPVAKAIIVLGVLTIPLVTSMVKPESHSTSSPLISLLASQVWDTWSAL